MHLEMLIVAAGAAFGGFAQGLSGFAFGLIAISIWVWVLDPILIAPLIVFGSLAGQFATAGILRHAWKILWAFGEQPALRESEIADAPNSGAEDA